MRGGSLCSLSRLCRGVLIRPANRSTVLQRNLITQIVSIVNKERPESALCDLFNSFSDMPMWFCARMRREMLVENPLSGDAGARLVC